MNSSETIILCQPDPKKGCAVCCGLFNHIDISRENLSRILSLPVPTKRQRGEDAYGEEYLKRTDIRDITSHICPYQGFIGTGKPGCRLHPSLLGIDRRNRSLYGAKICDSFLCPAHRILTETHKRALVDLTDDWYFYSIEIIDPDGFLWIFNSLNEYLEDGHEISCHGRMKSVMNEVFSAHAEMLGETTSALFQYGLHEYSLNKGHFSLASNTGNALTTRENITEILSKLQP